jgi:hypothetical protein
MWRRVARTRGLCPAVTVKVVSVMYAWERHEVDDQLSLPSALLKLNVAVSYLV